MNSALRTVLFTTPYVRQARDLFDRFATPPATDRRVLINSLVKSLVQAGIWDKLDAFYMLAAADAQSALLNWVSTSYSLTAVSSPTFAADRGYTSNGTSSYLDTGFNPTTAVSPKYLLDSAHLGSWLRNDLTNLNYFDIGNNGARFNARSSSANALRGFLNDATNGNFGANATSIGHFVLNRSAAGARQGYQNGSALGSDTQASTALSNSSILILQVGSQFSLRQSAAAHFGASLSAAEDLALYNALNTYLLAVGAA